MVGATQMRSVSESSSSIALKIFAGWMGVSVLYTALAFARDLKRVSIFATTWYLTLPKPKSRGFLAQRGLPRHPVVTHKIPRSYTLSPSVWVGSGVSHRTMRFIFYALACGFLRKSCGSSLRPSISKFWAAF